MQEFQSLGLSQNVLSFIKEKDFQHPTRVQKEVIPRFLQGQSLGVLSPTGSGKTLSYALPIVQLLKLKEENQKASKSNPLPLASPMAIVLAPTRELAQQIFGVFKDLSHHERLRVRLITGGKRLTNLDTLKGAAFEILIGTPHQIKKGLLQKELSLSHLSFLILDEADQLLDMGFGPEVEKIYSSISHPFQVGLFSATMPEAVEKLIKEKFSKSSTLKSFEMLMLPESHKILKRIKTFNIEALAKDKEQMLSLFLEKQVKGKGKGLIFITRKEEAEYIFKRLMKKTPHLKAQLFHGGLTPQQRRVAFSEFLSNKVHILITTDLAARGMDIKGVEWVLNYDFPKTINYYLHRCGRVARHEDNGLVFNFVMKTDAPFIQKINQAIRSQQTLDIEPIQFLPKTEKDPSAQKDNRKAKGEPLSQPSRKGLAQVQNKKTIQKTTKKPKERTPRGPVSKPARRPEGRKRR